MNEQIVTCQYCHETIEVGKGIYLERNFELGQMGWFHYGPCKWYIEDQWNGLLPEKKNDVTYLACEKAYQQCWNKGLVIDADAMKRHSSGLLSVEQAQEYLNACEYTGDWGSIR